MNHDRRPTRSLCQPRILLVCLVLFLIINLYGDSNDNTIDIEEALFLTKNSLKQLKEQYLPSKNHPSHSSAYDIDYPLGNAMNSFLPLDSLIQFNTTTPGGNITTHELIARYAAFSPILTRDLVGQYRILPDGACNKIEPNKDITDKILIVMRGNCTFVDKVSNIIESDLEPKAIVVANDEPNKGLITMYSNTFNQDGNLRIPIMFITYEAFSLLSRFQSEHVKLTLSTASFGSWFNVMLSMVLSPPLLILIFYLVIICGQKWRRRQINIQNSKLVRELPVYLYNVDHLISIPYLPKYLKVTGQSLAKPSPKDDYILDSPKTSNASSRSNLHGIVVNGVNISDSAESLHVLTAPKDFYPSYKCSICLDQYTPLNSRVLILSCKHFYHEKCLSNWLINFKRSCPLCNTLISRQSDPLLAGQDRSLDYGTIGADLESQSSIHSLSVEASRSYTDNVYRNSSLEGNYNAESLNQYYTRSSTEPSVAGWVASSAEAPAVYHTSSIGPSEVAESDRVSLGIPGSSSSSHNQLSPVANTGASAVDSHVSDSTSYYSAASVITDGNRNANPNPSRFYAKPSHILRQFSSLSTLQQANERDLSVSIDTSNYLTPRNSPHSPSGINELEPIPSNEDSTIDLSSDDDTNTINH